MKLKSSLLALTLIEFLIAFAIFSTVSLSIYGTFSSGMQINKRTKNFEHFFRSIHWSLDTIAFDLENMVPYQFKDQDPPIFAFSGDEAGFSLIAPSDSGLKRISYHLIDPKEAHIHQVVIGAHSSKNISVTSTDIQTSEKTSFLIRQEQSWGKTTNDEILNKQALRNSLKISYASYDKDSLIWKNEWKDPSPPAGIRLQITFLNPDDPKDSISIDKIIVIPIGLWGKFNQ